jgi:hypothetical protein
MLGAYFVVALLGLLAVGLVGWVIAGEVAARRKARAAAQAAMRFQRIGRDQAGDES